MHNLIQIHFIRINDSLSLSFHSMLQYLFDNTWLDVFTRAIFVEFTVYNANVNLFGIVTLMLETNAVGKKTFPIKYFKHRKLV